MAKRWGENRDAVAAEPEATILYYRGVFTVVSHGGIGACTGGFIRWTTACAVESWNAKSWVRGIQQKPLGPLWPMVWGVTMSSRGTCPCPWTRVLAVPSVVAGQPVLWHGPTAWTIWRCWTRSIASCEGRTWENYGGTSARMGWIEHWVSRTIQDQGPNLVEDNTHSSTCKRQEARCRWRTSPRGHGRTWSTWPMMNHGWPTRRTAPTWSTSWTPGSSMARRSASRCWQHVLDIARLTYHLNLRRARQLEPSWPGGIPPKERFVSTTWSSRRSTWASWWWTPSSWTPRRRSSSWTSRIRRYPKTDWLRIHETDLDMGNLGNGRKNTAVNCLVDTEETKEIQLIDIPKEHEVDDEEATDLLLTTMADLEEPNENPDEMVTLTESETKEILMTMVKDSKNKGRNFAGALKAKKNRDLARGYGAGRDGLLKPGTYEVSISELKKRTKCNSCGVVGHWARECPTKPRKNKNFKAKSKEVNFLSQDMPNFAESDFFYLEYEEFHGSNCSASDNVDLSRASREYTVRPTAFPCFHTTTILDDNGCATIDTGCQRMAIGINTLQRLQKSQPSSLPISFCKETHQFGSVHKVSCTTRLACIPCS